MSSWVWRYQEAFHTYLEAGRRWLAPAPAAAAVTAAFMFSAHRVNLRRCQRQQRGENQQPLHHCGVSARALVRALSLHRNRQDDSEKCVAWVRHSVR